MSVTRILLDAIVVKVAVCRSQPQRIRPTVGFRMLGMTAVPVAALAAVAFLGFWIGA